jgi:hypothetical protein
VLQGGDHPAGTPYLPWDRRLSKAFSTEAEARPPGRDCSIRPCLPSPTWKELNGSVGPPSTAGPRSTSRRAPHARAVRLEPPPGGRHFEKEKAPAVVARGHRNQRSPRKGMRVGTGSLGRVRTKRPSWTSIRKASPSRKPARVSQRPRRRIIGTVVLASKYEVTVAFRRIGTSSHEVRRARRPWQVLRREIPR